MEAFILIHVAISLAGILCGFVVLFGRAHLDNTTGTQPSGCRGVSIAPRCSVNAAFLFAEPRMLVVGSRCALFGLLTAKRLDGWTALLLATTAATGVTGFFFPFLGVTPAIVARARLNKRKHRKGKHHGWKT
jgi:hypothetical protein